MNHQLSISELSKITEGFDKLNDNAIETLSKQLTNRQPYLTSLIEASYEIFEDEEEFNEELDYYFLLIDYIFSKTLGETETIMPDFLEAKDEEHISIIDKIADTEDFDDRILELFESHPRADLVMYFYDELFDEDIDFDDQTLELTTQLIMMLYFIIDVYHYSTLKTNEA